MLQTGALRLDELLLCSFVRMLSIRSCPGLAAITYFVRLPQLGLILPLLCALPLDGFAGDNGSAKIILFEDLKEPAFYVFTSETRNLTPQLEQK